ncbi:AMP-binding protein [Streptomyces canarius]
MELPIHEAVLGRAAAFGDQPALIDGTDGTTLTYEQVDRFHRRLAAALAEKGVRKGDVLALGRPNTIAFPTAFYAATRAGAAVTTVHPLATAEEFAGSSATARPAGSSPSPRCFRPPAGPPNSRVAYGRSSCATAPPGTAH